MSSAPIWWALLTSISAAAAGIWGSTALVQTSTQFDDSEVRRCRLDWLSDLVTVVPTVVFALGVVLQKWPLSVAGHSLGASNFLPSGLATLLLIVMLLVLFVVVRPIRKTESGKPSLSVEPGWLNSYPNYALRRLRAVPARLRKRFEESEMLLMSPGVISSLVVDVLLVVVLTL